MSTFLTIVFLVCVLVFVLPLCFPKPEVKVEPPRRKIDFYA